MFAWKIITNQQILKLYKQQIQETQFCGYIAYNKNVNGVFSLYTFYLKDSASRNSKYKVLPCIYL
jgi:hypothetical protein